MNKIILPRDFAVKAHANQKYGNDPYERHLCDVVDVFNEFSQIIIDNDGNYYIIYAIMESAAWLHDVLEDTDISYEKIRDTFGSNVADLVNAVTDEPGKNRKERKANTLPKIKEYGYLAIALKLCDRIANIENCIDTKNKGLMKMYAKEYPSFKEALYHEGDLLDPMWDRLDEITDRGLV